MRRPSRSAARSRTTCSRSTSPAAPTSTRRASRCGSSPTSSPTAASTSRSWNTISISGYHIREAGSHRGAGDRVHARQRASRTCRPRSTPGLDVDEFAPRLSFFWNGHNNFFEEVAKFRAARRMWYRIMTRALRRARTRRRSCCASTPRPAARRSPRSSRRTTSCGSPLQALAAVLGGTQSLHTNGFDEALGLPTERAATHRPAHAADRRLRVAAWSTRRTRWPGPTSSSRSPTRSRPAAWEYIERIDEMGGAVAAIEAGFHDGRDRAGGLRVHEVDRRRRAGHRRRQPVHGRRTSRSPTSSRSTRVSRPRSSPGWRGSRPTATAPRWAAASRTSGPRRRGRRTCCRRCGRAGGPLHARRGQRRPARRLRRLPPRPLRRAPRGHFRAVRSLDGGQPSASCRPTPDSARRSASCAHDRWRIPGAASSTHFLRTPRVAGWGRG